MKKEILKKTAIEYYESAQEAFNKKRYNSAVVLYFKTLVTLSDIYIFIKIGNTPSSHTTRFRMTENKFPEIYNLLDKDFPFYQDSYTQIMSKELAEVIRDDAISVAKKVKIKI